MMGYDCSVFDSGFIGFFDVSEGPTDNETMISSCTILCLPDLRSYLLIQFYIFLMNKGSLQCKQNIMAVIILIK